METKKELDLDVRFKAFEEYCLRKFKKQSDRFTEIAQVNIEFIEFHRTQMDRQAKLNGLLIFIAWVLSITHCIDIIKWLFF